ncbi:MAG: zinc ribbon domain-containing protein [Raoultibacter sp.]
MKTMEVLADLREKNNLTQDEMAEKLFVTRQAVSRWETGKTTPNPDTLKLISKEFNISINSLLGSEEAPVCQSCSMTLLTAEDLGTEADGGVNNEYCSHCYQNGGFTDADRTLEEMIETNLHFLDEFNAQSDTAYSMEEARAILRIHLATLKRWAN